MKPLAELHVEKSKTNFSMYEIAASQDSQFRGWQITTLFYSALHYVQAYVVEFGLPLPTNHYSRDRIIRLDQTLAVVGDVYASLKDLSMGARYEVVNIPASAVADALGSYDAIVKYLGPFLIPAPIDPTEADNE